MYSRLYHIINNLQQTVVSYNKIYGWPLYYIIMYDRLYYKTKIYSIALYRCMAGH